MRVKDKKKIDINIKKNYLKNIMTKIYIDYIFIMNIWGFLK